MGDPQVSTWSKMEECGIAISDRVSRFVGTWTFVLIYTISMISWIGLHWAGMLHIDTPDFIKWNLWLSYFAGTQASIVLMSSARALQQDRQRAAVALALEEESLAMSKSNSERMILLLEQVMALEEVIDRLLEERNKGGSES